MELARRLRELRGPSSQKDVATCLGVSAALISSWEGGHAIPTGGRVTTYADFFDPERELGLHEELLELRSAALSALVEPTQSTDPLLLDVLRDIRWILTEIRDRLPPATR